MFTSHDAVIADRLATQRLTSVGHASTVDVVRDLVCVQSQDAPLARYSIGLRLCEAIEDDVRAAINDHQIIRTHILRTTCHYVARDDLRWILALTSPRVIASMKGRWARLGLDPAMFQHCEVVLNEILTDGQTLTRPELAAQFVHRVLPGKGEQLTHLIMRAELVGQICGAGLSADQHTYGLFDQLVPPSAPREHDAAMHDLVVRFINGHGPATERDIARYATLRLTDIRRALADLAGELVSSEVDGQTLWSNPASRRINEDLRAFLLPTFDEAFLAFVQPNFRRTAGHPRGNEPPSFAEAAGGLVV
ncbi:MAG: winged helix DNA-binding domain-containing protein, partial [Antricoccus sp.]